jgi:hypothetical protein
MAHVHTPTDEAELSDFLDRILDKGLVLGSADSLIVRFNPLADSNTRVCVEAMRTYFGGWMPQELRTQRPFRVK